MQLLSCSFLTGPATKKSKIVRLQLLPCSPLAGPAAKKSQEVRLQLLVSCGGACCLPATAGCPAALLLGLRPQKSPVVRLQLLPCSSCWACRPKNLKQSDCSCCLAALVLGLPPQKSQERLSCSFLTGPATKESKIVRLQLLPCSPLAGPTAKKNSSSQIAVATVAFLILNGPAAVQKISSNQIAVATLQFSCWACRLRNFKYADCSCSAAFLLKRKIWSRSVQAKNFEIDATRNQMRANQHCQ